MPGKKPKTPREPKRVVPPPRPAEPSGEPPEEDEDEPMVADAEDPEAAAPSRGQPDREPDEVF